MRQRFGVHGDNEDSSRYTFLLCSYLFVFFKLQATVFLLLPPENKDDGKDWDYYPVKTLIVVLWSFQTIVILGVVYDQCRHEIFFIDWERNRQPAAGLAAPVSIWRTIFIANEWNELQTSRKTSIHFILAWLTFFLIYLGLENNATSQPDLGDLEDGQLNIALRFANTTWWWLILALMQYVWNGLIYQRFISEPRAQSFVDLCTVAKISVLVLDSKYHGYYLHGDSPYPHADDTMAELTRHLANEANAESVSRGLDSALPDVQTFELWLSPHFRRAWDSVHAKVNSASSADSEDARLVGPAGHRGLRPPPISSALLGRRIARAPDGALLRSRAGRAAAAEKLNAFLRTFLSHGYKERFHLDWRIHLPSKQESILKLPPRNEQDSGPVLMQPDLPWFGGDYSWTTVTFLGHDYELLLLEMLTFAVADIWFRRTALSILVTFLLHHGIRLLRALAGEKNLSDRTLVDSRFLI
mmetsp:Transcript_4619/g.14625  ORF Transcript_4619/g.14625 Transcript_4619/m.14625 type:complete len:470 (-) Transcript_4619:2368-3777(-)